MEKDEEKQVACERNGGIEERAVRSEQKLKRMKKGIIKLVRATEQHESWQESATFKGKYSNLVCKIVTDEFMIKFMVSS